MNKKLEIACFDPASALVAAGAGAHRIELCDQLHEGGTSPSIENVETVLSQVQIPFFLMVRLVGGYFVYTHD